MDPKNVGGDAARDGGEAIARIVVYTTSYCGYCHSAKELLRRRKLPFEEVDVTADPETRSRLVRETGRRTVPQIFIDGRPIGGCDELWSLDESGDLDALVRRTSAPA